MVKFAGCAGHAGFGVTAGKRTPDGEYEWDFNNKVILAFEETLKQYENAEFLRTDDRTGRTDVPLKTRTDKANAWGADFYISFHKNGNTGKWGNWGGTETFCYPSGKSLELAKLVHAAQMKVYGLRDRGVKDGSDLWIIRKTNMPSVLLEGAFMDSTTDIVKLRDDKVLHMVGCEVAHAVAEYYGLKKKVVAEVVVQPAPVETPDSQIPFKVIVPNTAYWQTVVLIKEFTARGYKSYGQPVDILCSPEIPKDSDPLPFVIETNYAEAKILVKELQDKGYKLAQGVRI
jgi:N-acetylmuramoyl-L-alanine amidase